MLNHIGVSYTECIYNSRTKFRCEISYTRTRKNVHINMSAKSFREKQPSNVFDVNLLHFCMWEYLKILGYSPPIKNEDTLHQRIFDACQTTRNCPGTFEIMR